MKIILYEIEYIDWRKYRVFCANKTQIKKFLIEYNQLKNKWIIKELKEIVWIHTLKEYLKIIATDYESKKL